MIPRAALAFLLLCAPPALAAESAAVSSPRVMATLITDTDAVAPGEAFGAGLRLRLQPGWHVYWRNPGEAGQETVFTPALPEGASAGPVAWPAPRRFSESGITVYGYENEVVLPVAVTPVTVTPVAVTPGAEAAAGFGLRAEASWLVCQSICVPESGTFALELPWGRPSPSAAAPLMRAALARVPVPAPDATVSSSGVLTLPDAGSVQTATFYPDTPDTITDGADQAPTVRDGRVSLHLTPGQQWKPAALTGVVVLRDRSGAERAVAVSPRLAAAPAPEAGLGWTLALAFAGGLLLNLMPCVFPILAMKAAGLARLGGTGRGAVRREALSYTAGVLATFCTLGGALAASGAGWGTQFQSPLFVAGAAWLLFAVGLNLSGVFAVGGSMAGAGSQLAARGGVAGAFFTGALAVLVAAPCTAPFMGTAVAAALTLPGPAALAVFAAMGAGLALPYLLLAAWPGAARPLPRPGRWMEVLKGALAFPMYAASAWLVWVVSTEAGTEGVLVAGAGLVLVGFAAWVWTVANGRWPGRALAGAAVLGLVALLTQWDEGAAQAAGAEPFSTARLAALRAEGRPVFVDMTASWCIPCLLNERIALSPAEVRQAFADRQVALLRGDWTRKDPAITAFLQSQNRDGVPLYLFYPPGAEPVVLPQVLTAGTVLDEINRSPPRS